MKAITGLTVGFVVYVVVAYYSLNAIAGMNTDPAYTKVSVDDTPLFILTHKQTGCRYVYNSLDDTVTVAKGSEGCTIPASEKTHDKER